MNQYQNKKLSMYLVMQDYLNEVSPDVLSLMPNFNLNLTLFVEKVTYLYEQLELQRLNRGGYAANKQLLKTDLSIYGAFISAKMVAFANNTSNFVLLDKVNYSRSKLSYLADTALVTAATIIYEQTSDNLSLLTAYGITSDELDDLQRKITNFSISIPQPRANISIKRASTSELKVVFLACNVLLRNMDLLSKTMQLTDSTYYENYFNRRHTERPKYRKWLAKGTVRDVDGVLMGNVWMVCTALGIKKRVGSSGIFYLRSIPDGVYEFEFRRTGYVTEVVTVTIFYSVTSVVEVVMVAV
jgi:hypothetical protein